MRAWVLAFVPGWGSVGIKRDLWPAVVNMRAEDSILLVEDNEDDAFITSKALRKAGLNHRLEVVRSGGEAMRYLAGEGAYADRTAHPVPALVVVNADLKEVSGLCLLQWIRSQRNLTPVRVVLLSDYPALEQLPFERLGAVWVLRPAGFPELVELLAHLRSSSLEAPLWGGEWERAA